METPETEAPETLTPAAASIPFFFVDLHDACDAYGAVVGGVP